VWTIEQVCDDIRSICRTLLEDDDVDADVIGALVQFSAYVEHFTAVFYKHSNDDLWEFREMHYRFIDSLKKIDADSKTGFRVIALMTGIVEKLRHLTLSLL
jgi:hypothetical protein